MCAVGERDSFGTNTSTRKVGSRVTPMVASLVVGRTNSQSMVRISAVPLRRLICSFGLNGDFLVAPQPGTSLCGVSNPAMDGVDGNARGGAEQTCRSVDALAHAKVACAGSAIVLRNSSNPNMYRQYLTTLSVRHPQYTTPRDQVVQSSQIKEACGRG